MGANPSTPGARFSPTNLPPDPELVASSDFSRSPLALANHADGFLDALDTPEGRAQSGLTEDQLAELRASVATLRTLHEARRDAEAARRAAVRATQQGRDATEALYRKLRTQAGSHTAMTDALRAQAGLRVPDREPSPGLLPEILPRGAVPGHPARRALERGWGLLRGVGAAHPSRV
jgi:hypothetical protein